MDRLNILYMMKLHHWLVVFYTQSVFLQDSSPPTRGVFQTGKWENEGSDIKY